MDEKKNKTLAKIGRIFRDGLITQNPVLIQLLGMCSVLAISTSVQNGLGMGLAVTFVLTGSNIVISLIRSAIPNKIRIASFVVVISGFVTAIDLIIKAFLPSMSDTLGISSVAVQVAGHLYPADRRQLYHPRPRGELRLEKQSVFVGARRDFHGPWIHNSHCDYVRDPRDFGLWHDFGL